MWQYKANSFHYTEQQYYLCNYTICSPQATTYASVLPCCCKIASPVFWKKLKAQLGQPFMKSHCGLLKLRVSWRRGTGCLPLTVLAPTLRITGMISEKTNSFTSMLRHRPHAYGLPVLIQDRENTDLNAVTSDPQQKGHRSHALSMTAARHNSCNEPST